ncbi:MULTISPECIES: hypothetical protein [unclassified Leptolyngbya]|uniref:hypothetical protein n=1 Tax=unclassified Leptolyngbya TaxID=2650499 RepID=UPI001681EB3B|nr:MULTISPECIES: hypothetical protein [unclassified Leptolyngbya]MBD1911454.1 hypothetical protein [Leptolyngbya sp. FACHB-8]MBD2153466.1 hypothetical protein [Leptolyngbya sp. FACHB-16]
MSVQAIGNPPPEADQLRAEIEQQLPAIIASFSQVLREQFGFEGIRVGGFTIVPEEAAASISCNEENCSIDG